MKDVVGYIRVSTPRQAELGGSLVEQAYVLRGYCDEKELNLLTIEEDDCSAAGAQGHLFRPGLRQAIQIAKEKRACLLVPRVDRLARHPAVLSEILESGIPVMSIAERRRVGRRSLERLLHNAQRDRDRIVGQAREGMARARKRGVKLGNRKNLDIAQRNGAISNVVRADRKATELADFIERTSGWDKLALREKVDLTNLSGPHNLISETRNERRPWTIGSIRKPLKRAEAELDLRRAMENDPYDLSRSRNLHSSQDERESVNNGDSDREKDIKEQTPTDVVYKDHPGFGKF